MRRLSRVLLFLSVLAILPIFWANAAMKLEYSDGNLTGKIYELGTNNGIPDLTVKLIPPKGINEPEKVTTTDRNGAFRFSKLREGKYLLAVYQGVTILYRDLITIKQNMRKDIFLKRK